MKLELLALVINVPAVWVAPMSVDIDAADDGRAQESNREESSAQAKIVPSMLRRHDLTFVKYELAVHNPKLCAIDLQTHSRF